MIQNDPRFRPPAEAYSLVLQVDEGCPHNRCTFCGMYKDMPYRPRRLAAIEALIAREAAENRNWTRVFLADGDVMRRPFPHLQQILECLNRAFPALRRVNVYANGSSIAARSEDELRALRRLKLHTLYMGLESGDETLLRRCNKGESAETMANEGLRAQACGLRMSVMVLLGLGGVEGSHQHARETACILNRMQPRLLSMLRVVPVAGTALATAWQNGTFQMLSERQVVEELLHILSALDLEGGTVFRANHASNVVPLEGRLPRDKAALLAELKDLLAAGRLDEDSAGSLPFYL